jgi:hypothetical protein
VGSFDKEIQGKSKSSTWKGCHGHVVDPYINTKQTLLKTHKRKKVFEKLSSIRVLFSCVHLVFNFQFGAKIKLVVTRGLWSR